MFTPAFKVLSLTLPRKSTTPTLPAGITVNKLNNATAMATTATTIEIEAYKIADLLAENGSCAALWPDWWGFKMEAYDMVQENVAIVDAVKNSCAVVHSDSDTTIQRLNQEAGKVMFRANDNGFDISEAHAIKWITVNAAKSLGIDDKTGSLEAGKQGDVVIWNQSPFSVYAKAEQVFIDGAKVYDRDDATFQAQSDFMLGQK